MKKLMTAAMLAALTITTALRAEEPVRVSLPEPTKPPEVVKTKPPEAVKPVVKKITIEDVGQMLENMGYEPRPGKNAEGKLVGYYVDVTREGDKITCYISVSGGTTIWIDMTLLKFDDKNKASLPVMLGLLAEQDAFWPAYIAYFPKTKVLQLVMPVQGPNITASTLRNGLDSFAGKFSLVKAAYIKAIKQEQAKQEEAEEEAETIKK